MVDILNLRPSTEEASTSPSSTPEDGSSNNEEHKVTSPPSSLKESIIQGLKGTTTQVPGQSPEDEQWKYTKTIPTVVLYDHKGLDIYDDITQTDDYYLFNSELSILKTHGCDIARRLFASQQHKITPPKNTNKRSSSPSTTSEVDSSEGDNGSEGDGGGSGGSSEDSEDTGFGSKDSGFQSLASHKEKWGDGRVGRNNFGVNGSLSDDDTSNIETTGSVIELGAGSLKKTSVLLQAISDTILSESILSNVNYFALDLEYGQLVQTLDSLKETIPDAITTSDGGDDEVKEGIANDKEETGNKKILARGICASYDEALPYLKQGKLDNSSTIHSERKNILFLGSSIGNYSREEGAEFLQKISNEAMSVGDTLLIGIDGCDDGPRIEKAYNDSLGVTRAFILNGVDHVSRILNEDIEEGSLTQDKFEYANRYNKRDGRHEAYLRVKENFELPISGEVNDIIKFEKDELIAVERSYKYTDLEASKLFSYAGLRLVQKWTDDKITGNYHLYLLEKAPFHFPSTIESIEKGENPFGLPSLEEWDRLWSAWDTVTLSMIPRDLLHTKPIDLRHICLFYLGHIPGFLDIQLSKYTGEGYTEPSHYPEMFERGIDPNMEDPSKVHAHSVVPTQMEDWPHVDEIVEYRDRVRSRLHNIYEQKLDGKKSEEIDTRLVRVLQMVYEHEVMHLETLLYMCAQIPAQKLNPAPGFTTPDWRALALQWRAQVEKEQRSLENTTVTFPASSVEIGHDDFDHLDHQTSFDAAHTFGWDNESPKRTVQVPTFKISLLPISNGDYLEFWQSVPQDKKDELLPGSWTVGENGNVSIKVLTAPSLVPIDIARDWPVMASGKQLAAHAESVGGRLPTEPELRRFIVDNPVDHVGANIGFANWHPVPARLPAVNRDGSKTGASNGGVWEWCSTEFSAYEGWRTSELYPGYSEDFFDGCHWIMLGGSFATIPRVAGRKTFTNWYQAGYPYVFAGGRVAYDV